MKCPICEKQVLVPSGDQGLGTFPFCGERCKLVDLGRWLGGKYHVPLAEPDASMGGNPACLRREPDDDREA